MGSLSWRKNKQNAKMGDIENKIQSNTNPSFLN